MFDFDGTITEKGVYYPPQEMVDALVDLAQVMPIGFCTGRQLESFLDHGLSELLKGIAIKKRHGFLENLFLFAENGALGYDFNTDLDEFEEFYRVEWPADFMELEAMRALIDKKVKGIGEVYFRAHREVVVIRTLLHSTPGRDIKDVYKSSEKIYEIVLQVLTDLDPEFEKYVHVGNSGIGVIIGPAKGDKDAGIRMFAKFLNEKRNFGLGDQAREIMVIGDQPRASGNDHYFLKGNFGSAFTVGDLVKGAKWPIPVLTDNGDRLLHVDGTLHLVRRALGLK